MTTAKPYYEKSQTNSPAYQISFRMDLQERAGQSDRLSESLSSTGPMSMPSSVVAVQGPLQSKLQNPWRAELSEWLQKEEVSWEPATNHQLINKMGATVQTTHSHSGHICNSHDFLRHQANRTTDEELHLVYFKIQLLPILQHNTH